MEPILTRYARDPEQKKIDVAVSHGAYEAAKKALAMKPEEVIETVKSSGLRGRGGAGFPTGNKWSFIPAAAPVRYLAVNADESEPGTFKDRLLIEGDPHLLLEGIIIASYAIKCRTAFIYIRGEFTDGANILREAIREAYAKGILGEKVLGTSYALDVLVARGAGAYICGEETGLLESLEGHRGQPRVKPPFPAIRGLFGQPTIVNNVETLCCVPPILSHGAEWFKKIGPEKSPGPKLFCISGRVRKPGIYELPMGIPAEQLVLEYGGGVPEGRKIKGIIPGGSSAAVLGPKQFGTPLDFDSLGKIGNMLGSAGVIVLDDTVCAVDALTNIMRFYAHESCGQCTPCREGTAWSVKILTRLERGEGVPRDLENIANLTRMISGRALCPLADGAAMPLTSFFREFKDEFVAHLEQKRCPMRGAAVPGEQRPLPLESGTHA
ncbi:MAG: NADH-quinone oxidoreductase subunit NuoF [Nitrospirae bacterium]|nr:NADH-quinone oxidoreductase subunit NuoF [Nitrospirota bacterium]